MPAYLWLATVLAHAASFVLSGPSVPVHPRAIADGTVLESILEVIPTLSVGPTRQFSSDEIESTIPYTWFSQAAWCHPAKQANWSCDACLAEPVKDFQVHASGGDGDLVPYWYVGWWPSGQSIVVAHEGTDFNNTFPILTDATLVRAPLDKKLFPGAPKSATVHLGFKIAHETIAGVVLKAVNEIIDKEGATKVVTVGHSLGGALALLSALHLRQQLPSEVSVAARTLGQPRVGDDVFARFVDQTLPDVVRVINKRDLVPVVLPVLLGYRHSSGEVHINNDGIWNACSGRDNLNKNCSMGDVLARGLSWTEHFGPYADGIMQGAGSCGALPHKLPTILNGY